MNHEIFYKSNKTGSYSDNEIELEKRDSKNIIVPDGKPENSEDLSSLSLLEAQNQKEILQIFSNL